LRPAQTFPARGLEPVIAILAMSVADRSTGSAARTSDLSALRYDQDDERIIVVDSGEFLAHQPNDLTCFRHAGKLTDTARAKQKDVGQTAADIAVSCVLVDSLRQATVDAGCRRR
jgi:hypothetical protein